jgi:hypothetical protein
LVGDDERVLQRWRVAAGDRAASGLVRDGALVVLGLQL